MRSDVKISAASGRGANSHLLEEGIKLRHLQYHVEPEFLQIAVHGLVQFLAACEPAAETGVHKLRFIDGHAIGRRFIQ